MNIKTRMKKIRGVQDVGWNSRAMSLAIYYDEKSDLSTLKVKVASRIGDAGLNRAIEKINFYSMPTTRKKRR